MSNLQYNTTELTLTNDDIVINKPLLIGDDVRVADINVGNTLRVYGNQNAAAGYIQFGNADGKALGRTGAGDLTWNGNTLLTAGGFLNGDIQLYNGTGDSPGLVLNAHDYNTWTNDNWNGIWRVYRGAGVTPLAIDTSDVLTSHGNTVWHAGNVSFDPGNTPNTAVYRNGYGNFSANDVVLAGTLYLQPNLGSIKTNTGLELLLHNNDYMSLGYGMNYIRTFRPFVLNNNSATAPEVQFHTSGYNNWAIDAYNGQLRIFQNGDSFHRIILEDKSLGGVLLPNTYNITTTNSPNVYIHSNGKLHRQSSSLKYKKDVEDINSSYVERFFDNARPVFYRAKESLDNPIDWGYWGFIAEEVAEYDKRLVFWRYDGENVEVVETKLDHPAEPERTETVKEEVIGEDGTKSIVEKEIVIPAKEATYKEYTTTKFVEDRDKPMIAEGVQYDRITVLLTSKVQSQQKEIKSLRSELDELKLLIKGLV